MAVSGSEVLLLRGCCNIFSAKEDQQFHSKVMGEKVFNSFEGYSKIHNTQTEMGLSHHSYFVVQIHTYVQHFRTAFCDLPLHLLIGADSAI